LRGPFGVNLVGYAKGELGIGEDVRMLALALEANGVPFCIVDVELGAHVSQMDRSVERWVSDRPRYPINLFCMTGIEQARYACEQGMEIFRGRYTIGLWPWELPEWPASCRYVFNVTDEIWGISAYTTHAYRGAPCPVYPMSLPVIAEPVGPETRTDFGLPTEAYLFLFAFDLHSTLARKNPEGVIRAFQQAFPQRRRDPVGLVIKASHTENAKGESWDQLKALVRSDPRIHLIENTLRKPGLLALYRCCDCFVSLHRAEGFGRSIAEALLLGLPVIATGFSGNLDYCREGQVDLVPYGMREVRRQEYFWGEGQHWAEPDLKHAAQSMRHRAAGPRGLVGNPLNELTPAAVGKRYVRRLDEIYRELSTP
jgi:glycosyltransferase involved in cell wall biosynthesis